MTIRIRAERIFYSPLWKSLKKIFPPHKNNSRKILGGNQGVIETYVVLIIGISVRLVLFDQVCLQNYGFENRVGFCPFDNRSPCNDINKKRSARMKKVVFEIALKPVAKRCGTTNVEYFLIRRDKIIDARFVWKTLDLCFKILTSHSSYDTKYLDDRKQNVI